MNGLFIEKIDFATPEYSESVVLRDLVLREPLGMVFYEKDLAKEWNQIHIAGFDERRKLVAILILKPITEYVVKMRQVAVHPSYQSKGIGNKLVFYSEVYAKRNGFENIELNARDVSVPFYLKQGYRKVGKEFEEVGIKHFKMEKSL